MREVESLIEESKKAIADDEEEDDSDEQQSEEEDEEAEDSGHRGMVPQNKHKGNKVQIVGAGTGGNKQ